MDFENGATNDDSDELSDALAELLDAEGFFAGSTLRNPGSCATTVKEYSSDDDDLYEPFFQRPLMDPNKTVSQKGKEETQNKCNSTCNFTTPSPPAKRLRKKTPRCQTGFLAEVNDAHTDDAATQRYPSTHYYDSPQKDFSIFSFQEDADTATKDDKDGNEDDNMDGIKDDTMDGYKDDNMDGIKGDTVDGYKNDNMDSNENGKTGGNKDGNIGGSATHFQEQMEIRQNITEFLTRQYLIETIYVSDDD